MVCRFSRVREVVTALDRIDHYAYAEFAAFSPPDPASISTARPSDRSRFLRAAAREPDVAWTVGESAVDTHRSSQRS
jgi:hypothetical protein